MKTNHVSTHRNYDNLNHAVRCALHDAHNRDGYLRVINCGKAVVILPDTNRAQDCEMPELLKAMGIARIEGGQPKLCEPPQEVRRENYVVSWDGDPQCIYSLTDEQIRFLHEMERQEMLTAGVNFEPFQNLTVCEV